MKIGGIASGLDIDSLVNDLMKAERIPLDKLQQQKIWTEWQQEAYREINLALTELRSSAMNIRFQSNYTAYSTTMTENSILKATANSNAIPGTYKVNVEQLASAAKITSYEAIKNDDGYAAKSSDKIGIDGTISIKDQNNNVIQVNITADLTFKQVAEQIQKATAGTNVELRANFDDTTSRFFITTKGMGEDQNFTLEFTDGLADKIINVPGQSSFSTLDATDDSTYMKKAMSAVIIFDGIRIEGLTSNETTVNGLTLTFNQVGKTEVTVNSDPAKIVDTIKSFVEKYNDIIKKIEDKLVEKRYRDYAPLTEEQKEAMTEKEIELWELKAKSGLLRSDSILQNALSNLRRAFMDPVNGIGDIKLLSQIGISTGNYLDGGKLTIDESKLTEALKKNPEEVIQLFTNKDSDNLGVMERVYKELNTTIKSLSDRAGSGSSLADNSTISKRIRQLSEEIADWQERLIKIENRYWSQFTAMEKAFNQLNQQSAYLLSFFGGS